MKQIFETGSCFCGNVAAQVAGDPFWICYDHDNDCRRAVGSPLNLWVGYRPSQIELLKGTPKRYSKTPGITRSFCADCGTSISYEDEGLVDEIYFTIGFLDHPELFAPQAHAYWRMKLPWVALADNLPRLDGYSRPRSESMGDPERR